MKRETAAALHAVNQRFYRERASEFSATRERPWRGWNELFDRCGALVPDSPRVLDLGCGNGRFARFLQGRLGDRFIYFGIDMSSLALQEAHRRLGSRENLVLIEHDFIASDATLPASVESGELDLIVLFGVLHHVPGRTNREELLERLSARAAPGGLVVYTLWQFDRHERFRRKLVSWPRFLEETSVSLDPSELEPGDSILTWGGDPAPGFRYCHAATEEEERGLVRASGLTLLEAFESEAEPNRYFVLRQLQSA